MIEAATRLTIFERMFRDSKSLSSGLTPYRALGIERFEDAVEHFCDDLKTVLKEASHEEN